MYVNNKDDSMLGMENVGCICFAILVQIVAF